MEWLFEEDKEHNDLLSDDEIVFNSDDEVGKKIYKIIKKKDYD